MGVGAWAVDRCIFQAAAGGTGSFTVSAAVIGYQTPTAAGAVIGQQYGYAAQSADLTQWEVGNGVWNGTVLSRAQVLFNSLGNTTAVSFSAAPQVLISIPAEDFFGIPANGNLIFYVSTTGNDTTAQPNNINLPYATGQAACNAASRYDYQVTWGATIQFLDGSYNPTQSSIVPNAFINIESGGLTIQGHVGDATKVTLTSQIQMNTDITVSTAIGWLTYNQTGNSCINPQNGGCLIFGDMIFAGSAIPFYLEGISQLFIANSATITVTATTLQYFLFCAPGVAVIQGGTNIKLPVALTVTNGFFSLVGGVDQTSIGVAVIQLGTPNWTNFNGVTGPRLENAAKGGILTLPTGELSDIPGTSNVTNTDGSVLIQNFNRSKAGFLARPKSGLPATTDIPQGCSGVIHDTSGGTTYLAYNNAGTIVKVALS